MSNDNVAVLTTLNVTVLIVGTVQYTRLLRTMFAKDLADVRAWYAARDRVLEAKRQGAMPSVEILQELRPYSPWAWLRNWRAGLAACIWCGICMAVLLSQIMMLQWIGDPSAGPDPHLARRCAIITSVSCIALVIEGIFGAFNEHSRAESEIRRDFLQRYTTTELRALSTDIRNAQAPPPPPIPTPPPPAAPPTGTFGSGP